MGLDGNAALVTVRRFAVWGDEMRPIRVLVLFVLPLIVACAELDDGRVWRKPPNSDLLNGIRASRCQYNAPDKVYFKFNSSDLVPISKGILREQADYLRCFGYGETLLIEGHADERGTREYNLALGLRRAAVVRDYLIALGVAPDRVSIVSYGKERPAVSRSDEEAWSQNRRAVSLLVKNAP